MENKGLEQWGKQFYYLDLIVKWKMSLIQFIITIYLQNTTQITKSVQSMKAHSATHQHDKTKAIFQFLPGPIKIKDGLFMGDQIAARDIEFIISNKVTHIINTVSKQIPNLWERFGIHYLSVNWTEKQQNIFDKKNNAINTIFHFIEQAMQQGQSCLIHSVNGKSRASAVLVAYMIKKYSWSLEKCLEFIASKKENLQIRNGFLVQLQDLQKRMGQIYNLTTNWTHSKNQEQLVLKNTFSNSKPSGLQKIPQSQDKKVKKKVCWNQKPIIVGSNKQPTQTKTMTNFKQSMQTPLKSILKGDPGPEAQKQANKTENGNKFQEFDEDQAQGNTKNIKRNEGSFINNINGNIVHVTVNNFITSQKKPQSIVKTPVNTRPYSSDQKDRQKQREKNKIGNPKKILAYDANPLMTFKSPYDNKLGGPKLSTGITTQNRPTKVNQKESKNNTVTTYQRPQSAKGRSNNLTNTLSGKLKDELIITNGLGNIYNMNRPKFSGASSGGKKY